MYKLLKDKGSYENITLMNTDTAASINLGQISMEILATLSKEGYSIGDEDSPIKANASWDLEVSEDTCKALSHIAMKIKKPERDQRKSEQHQNKKIDAMDVLLGLANYN